MTDKEKQDDILKRMRDNLERGISDEAENRRLMLDDLNFLEGNGQWPESIKSKRERQGRPCLTVNKLPQFVNQVVNDIRQNRPSIKVRPADDKSDPEVAEIFSGLIRDIEYQSRADVAYDTAAYYSTAMGMGFITVETCYADDDAFDQDIRIRRVTNPFMVYIDSDATEADKSDMAWAVVTREFKNKEFEARFPKASKSAVEGLSSSWKTQDSIRVAEYWERNRVEREILLLDDGSVVDASKSTPEIDSRVVGRRMSPRWKVMYYLCSGGEVLESKEWAGKYIPVVPVYGDEVNIDGKVYRKGLIRNAKDPQRMYNYWRTAATEMVALAPKTPYKVTPRQVEGLEGDWQEANSEVKPYLLYNPDPQAPAPMREPPVPVPSGIVTEAQIATDDLKATTGIYDASLGAKGNETSGRAILARSRQAETANFQYVDNLSRAISQVARILVDLIPKIYDTARIVRIIGEDGKEQLVSINQPAVVGGVQQVLNDLSVGRYDVVVTVGPSYATKRIEAADSLMQFAQAVPGAAALMADLIAKNMDWPGADQIADRLQTLLPDAVRKKESDGADPVAEAVKAAQEQMLPVLQAAEQKIVTLQQQVDDKQTDSEMKAAELALRNRELDIKAYDAETKRMSAETSAAVDMAELAGLRDELSGLRALIANIQGGAQVIPVEIPG